MLKLRWEDVWEAIRVVPISQRSFVVSHATKPFELLVSVILSQNTTDRNAIKSLKILKRALGEITPENILKTNINELEKLIKPAGLYKQKTESIIDAARNFLDLGGEEEFLKMGYEEARNFLLKIRGVGKKTTDVVLSITHKAPVFPVDTHIRRITKRLGLVDKNDYDKISRVWLEIVPKEKYIETHKRLIAFGRLICRAKDPRCDICKLSRFCKYAKNKNKIES